MVAGNETAPVWASLGAMREHWGEGHSCLGCVELCVGRRDGKTAPEKLGPSPTEAAREGQPASMQQAMQVAVGTSWAVGAHGGTGVDGGAAMPSMASMTPMAGWYYGRRRGLARRACSDHRPPCGRQSQPSVDGRGRQRMGVAVASTPSTRSTGSAVASEPWAVDRGSASSHPMAASVGRRLVPGLKRRYTGCEQVLRAASR